MEQRTDQTATGSQAVSTTDSLSVDETNVLIADEIQQIYEIIESLEGDLLNRPLAASQIPGEDLFAPLQQPSENVLPSLQLPGNLQLAEIPDSLQNTKEWQQSMNRDSRHHHVRQLVKALYPKPDPYAMIYDQRVHNLVAYARGVEGAIFETANSRSGYYNLLAENTYSIQKKLHEKRKQRKEQSQSVAGPSSRSCAPQQHETLQIPEELQFKKVEVRRYGKEWQHLISAHVRNHLVKKLVAAMSPHHDFAAKHNQRYLDSLIAYAKKVESEFFEQANSRNEFYSLLASKVYTFQKEHAARQRRKKEQLKQQRQQSQSQSAAGTSSQGADSAV